MQYTAENLLIKPESTQSDVILSIMADQAGWEYINFQVRRLAKGQQWTFSSGGNELAIIILTGTLSVTSNRGEWSGLEREDIFSSAAYVLYLPRQTHFTVSAQEDSEFAVTWVPTEESHDPWLIRPEDVPISVRGGDNVTRQINDLLPPDSPVHRLVLVEVYTPSGNWSSYPPHKHDVHREDTEGNIIEADLEEIYFYRFDPPRGYAYQRVYTDEMSPLHRAGYPIDAIVRAEHNSAVLVPEGHHPVASAPGFTTYYLNVLAGTAQSLANQDDPRYSWIKDCYQTVDERLPLY